MPPNISNVVVYAVVQNCVKEMAERAGGQSGHRQEGRHQNSLFCTYDGMIASSDPGWMQGAFSNLVCLFDWVVLRENFWKMVVMVVRAFQAVGTKFDK